jgi:hypothetical protein
VTIRAALAVLSVLALGCDPVMGIQGEVRSVPRPEVGRGAYDSGRPVADAELFFVCPNVEDRRFDTTEEDGTFAYVTAGWMPTQCSVEVRAVGYYPERFSLEKLCVHHDIGECHWANVSAELVPKAPRAGVPVAPPAAKPMHRVQFTAANPKLRIFERGDQKLGLVEFVPFGAAPVSSSVTEGKHRIAASLDGRSPVEASDEIAVSGPTRVELEYVDRSTLRTWKWVAFVSAFVAGPVLIALGAEAEDAARPVLVGAGVVVSVSGILFGMDANQTTDRLRVRATGVPTPQSASTASSP